MSKNDMTFQDLVDRGKILFSTHLDIHPDDTPLSYNDLNPANEQDVIAARMRSSWEIAPRIDRFIAELEAQEPLTPEKRRLAIQMGMLLHLTVAIDGVLSHRIKDSSIAEQYEANYKLRVSDFATVDEAIDALKKAHAISPYQHEDNTPLKAYVDFMTDEYEAGRGGAVELMVKGMQNHRLFTYTAAKPREAEPQRWVDEGIKHYVEGLEIRRSYVEYTHKDPEFYLKEEVNRERILTRLATTLEHSNFTPEWLAQEGTIILTAFGSAVRSVRDENGKKDTDWGPEMAKNRIVAKMEPDVHESNFALTVLEKLCHSVDPRFGDDKKIDLAVTQDSANPFSDAWLVGPKIASQPKLVEREPLGGVFGQALEEAKRLGMAEINRQEGRNTDDVAALDALEASWPESTKQAIQERLQPIVVMHEDEDESKPVYVGPAALVAIYASKVVGNIFHGDPYRQVSLDRKISEALEKTMALAELFGDHPEVMAAVSPALAKFHEEKFKPLLNVEARGYAAGDVWRQRLEMPETGAREFSPNF